MYHLSFSLLIRLSVIPSRSSAYDAFHSHVQSHLNVQYHIRVAFILRGTDRASPVGNERCGSVISRESIEGARVCCSEE